MRADPFEFLRIDLIANHQEDTPPGTGFKNNRFAPPGGDTSPFSGAALKSFGQYRGGADLGLERELDSLTAIVAWDISDHWSFTSISGWREFESDEVFDGDGSQYDILIASELAEGEQFSQELRFNYDSGGAISAFFGANYLEEEGQQYVPVATDALQGVLFLAEFQATGQGSEPVAPSSGALYQEEFANTSDTESVDLFGDVTWHVTEKLELTAGVRWTRDDKETTYFGRSRSVDLLQNAVTAGSPLAGILPPVNVLGPGTTLFIAGSEGGGVQSAGDTFSGFSWRTVASYHFTEELNAWGSYARGRRPEVIAFNTPPDGGAVRPETLDAEKVDSVEIGGFSSLWDKRVNISGSVFYYEYTNFQTTIFVPGQAAVEVLNAGFASSYGAELQLDAQPWDFLQVFASYGYSHGRFDEKDDDGQPQQFGGNRFRLSPDHSYAIGATFNFPTDLGTFSFTPSYSYKSEFFFDDDNDRPDLQANDSVQDEVQGGYGLLDLSIRYETLSGKFIIELFGKNLQDKDYLLDAGNTGDSFGMPTFIPGPDKLVGISFTARYF